MKRVAVLIVGMVLLVFGAQGAIRLLVDHDNAGLLRPMPGGFPVRLGGYVVLAAVGLILAGWGGAKQVADAQSSDPR